MTVLGVVVLLLHAPAMGGMALLMAGALPWVRARWAGRAGPPLLQPLQDWRRAMRKQPVVSEGASPLAVWAPVAQLVAIGLAALLVPSFTLGMATAPLSDLIVVAGLLALARLVGVLAAIDAGTAPAGLAAIRSVRLGALAEPAMLLALFTVAFGAGTTNLDAAVAALHEAASPGLSLLLALAGLAVLVVAAEAEGNPAGAEASGWYAAAADMAVALRRVVWLSLVAALLLPGGIAAAGAGPADWVIGLLAWVVKLAVLGAAAGAAGPMLQRAGQVAIGPLTGAAVLLGLLAALFLFTGQGLN